MSASSPLAHPAPASEVRNVNNPIVRSKLTKLAPTAAIQHKPAKKTRNRIPPVQRIRVMQRYACGQNQTAIASEEKINRETVARIVKSAEMESYTEEIREQWRGLCDAAIESVRRLIAQDDRQTVFRVLESNRIIAPLGQAQAISAQPAAKPTGDGRVKELMEAFAGVAIERARVFKTPFPELAEIAEERDIELGFELNSVPDESDEEDEV